MKPVRIVVAAAVLLGVGLGLAFAAAWVLPLPTRLGEPPSTLVTYRDGSAAHVFTTPDGRWRIPVELGRIDPKFLRALRALEDKRFDTHVGVDPVALLRAAWSNVRAGRRVSGGSTLTMQLVRVLEPRARTLPSKCIEALRALQLELRLSKRDILRAYLQFAPYGRNVEGIESASLAYFGHSAMHLSNSEIATLLAVPQAPARRFPRAENQTALRRGRDWVAQRLLADAIIPGDAMLEVLAAPLPPKLRPFPRWAPHIANTLRAASDKARLPTTLDAGLQHMAEQMLARFRADARAQGIFNGAVVLIEHRSGEVRAAVGNFDFWDAAHGGQISALSEPRSPGSALKPFLYALAIDAGVAGPAQRVPDLPIDFGGYSPHNFDGEFRGLVPLEEALSQSLNVPFVHLLREVGVEPFLATLRRTGVTSLVSAPGHYGLSAAVGGVEITPLELAGLYTMLAENGRYVPLRWTLDAPALRPLRIVSPGAAFLTRHALSLRDRPDFPERREHNALPPGIHWKTGTSFGFRDAWAAGSTRTHTAVVWLGNLDARGARALTGAAVAAPLLFDMLEAVESRHSNTLAAADPMPGDLAQVEVCAFSGHAPSDACPARRTTLALRNAVPTKKCPFHVRVEVDKETGRAVTPECRGARDTQWRTFATWPARLKRFGRAAWLPLAEPPALAEACDAAATSSVSIVSPPPGQTALLIPGVPVASQPLALEAEALGTLSWFVDGRFLGTAHAEETLWWTPAPGRHEVVVSGAGGASARRVFEVAFRPN